jgi:hypothetical protein
MNDAAINTNENITAKCRMEALKYKSTELIMAAKSRAVNRVRVRVENLSNDKGYLGLKLWINQQGKTQFIL